MYWKLFLSIWGANKSIRIFRPQTASKPLFSLPLPGPSSSRPVAVHRVGHWAAGGHAVRAHRRRHGAQRRGQRSATRWGGGDGSGREGWSHLAGWVWRNAWVWRECFWATGMWWFVEGDGKEIGVSWHTVVEDPRHPSFLSSASGASGDLAVVHRAQTKSPRNWHTCSA